MHLFLADTPGDDVQFRLLDVDRGLRGNITRWDVDENMTPESAEDVHLFSGLRLNRLLVPEHIGLQRHKAAAGSEAAELGDGRLTVIGPALFGHGQAVGAAEKVGGLFLPSGQHGVQHGGEARAVEAGQLQPSLLGSGFGGVQAEDLLGHLPQYADLC